MCSARHKSHNKHMDESLGQTSIYVDSLQSPTRVCVTFWAFLEDLTVNACLPLRGISEEGAGGGRDVLLPPGRGVEGVYLLVRHSWTPGRPRPPTTGTYIFKGQCDIIL